MCALVSGIGRTGFHRLWSSKSISLASTCFANKPLCHLVFAFLLLAWATLSLVPTSGLDLSCMS
jgi:hypothetical protein